MQIPFLPELVRSQSTTSGCKETSSQLGASIRITIIVIFLSGAFQILWLTCTLLGMVLSDNEDVIEKKEHREDGNPVQLSSSSYLVGLGRLFYR